MLNNQLKVIIVVSFLVLFSSSCVKTGCQFAIHTQQISAEDFQLIETLLNRHGFEYSHYLNERGVLITTKENKLIFGKSNQFKSNLIKRIGTTDVDGILLNMFYEKLPSDTKLYDFQIYIENRYKCADNKILISEIEKTGNALYLLLVSKLGEHNVKKEMKLLRYPYF
ncbi:MAG: hypothetical protein LLF86_01180 [Nitrospiraceae bacterium]|nr:hypothetical protein [Nitrospiraceae bacterium]